MLTSKGPIEAREVVIATNGYTTELTPTLRRKLVPVASHIIATEELPEDLVKSLIPKNRVVSDTKRVLCYYRQSPDYKRVIFGGRARFTQVTPEVSAPVLHGYMLERWPQLKGVKVTHAWTGNVAFAFDFLPHMGMEQGMHYLMACNGSGVAMMSYLGYQTARKIAGGSNAPINAFDGQPFPTVPFYNGNPEWLLPLGRRLVSHPRLVGPATGVVFCWSGAPPAQDDQLASAACSGTGVSSSETSTRSSDSRLDRLLQQRHVGVAAVDAVALVAGEEHERHAVRDQEVGQRLGQLAGKVEIEHGAVEALDLGGREAVGQPRVGADHGGAEALEQLLGHHADQELVLDHQQALAGQAARAIVGRRLGRRRRLLRRRLGSDDLRARDRAGGSAGPRAASRS